MNARADRGAAILFLLLAIAIWILIPSQVMAGWGNIGAGPRYFPKLMSVTLGAFSVLLFIQSFFGKRPEVKTSISRIWAEQPKALLITIVLMLAYVLLLPYGGFLLTSAVVAALYMRFSGVPSWWRAILVSALASAVVFYGFRILLNVLLPSGLFE